MRQFSDLRCKATTALFETGGAKPSKSGKRPGKGDYFHNGEHVLPEVKQWHDFLRQIVRSTDVLSYEILNIIDDYLLVPEDKRLTASQLCDWFEDFLSSVNSAEPENTNVSDAVAEAIETALKREAEEVQDHLDSQSKVDRDLAKNDATYLQIPGLAVQTKAASSRTNATQEVARVSLAARVNLPNGRSSPVANKAEAPRPEMKNANSVVINNASSTQRQKPRRYCIFHAHYADKDEKLRDELDEGQVKSPTILSRLRSPKSKERGSLEDEKASANKQSVLRSMFQNSSPSKDRKLARYITNRDLVRKLSVILCLDLI